MTSETSSIVVNPHPSMHTKFYGFNQKLCDKCTWPWGHCLLFDLGGAPTTRLAAIKVKDSRHLIDNRRSLSRKNPVTSAGVERMG
ncbi:hypothetical protein TNCV_3328641 [Trichonephila clavipes]|nr:hypothetical protein TNCV_3328641 [Trichonephila clavipes]